ncbi:right-handed parallel beta-helix repeat-containing protein [Olivibacter sp. LS-1]|uniref:right-handed parallel beta-helix repeat-containing protein n=1 Tax=unclassified Olivibacter TaxID=2632301 RepID=UPI0011EA9EDF|nr:MULTISPECIES: right-handed parallel beta-helix repeat-containing protein [unclassified Olivibacter]MDM8177224.1 right-handed parallel beta-helix repeat-containing protein [Olivibacter sp. 47]QEL00380.1 right-handed parallel beta-helix repeat-containing protein [Olivibacter sp. LS-1]
MKVKTVKKLIAVTLLIQFIFLYVFSVDVYGQGNAKNKKYVKVVDFLPTNHVKNASVDYTVVLQSVLDKYSNVIFPSFPILINDKGLKLSSNSHLKFETGGGLVLNSTANSRYSMLDIEDVENVRVSNATLIGDRKTHKGTQGEWGMGVYIKGAKNVLLENINISEVWGDGIDIYKSSKQNSSNVTIRNVIIKRARRNGITIGSGLNIKIENCQISTIDGTLPMAGICVEPNDGKDYMGKVQISNVSTENCSAGLHIALLRYPSEQDKLVDINISGLQSKNDNHGLLVGDFFRVQQYGVKTKKLKGRVVFTNISITDSKKDPIKYFNSKAGYEYGPKFVFDGIQIKNKNFQRARIQSITNQLNSRGFDTKTFNRK